MRRRLDLAASLIAAPPVLFLDEPTTGSIHAAAWGCGSSSSELVAGGTTLLLTTQYLEEADRLADDIAVIDHGLVIARGTADELKAQIGGERLERDRARGSDQLEPPRVRSAPRPATGRRCDAGTRQVSVAVDQRRRGS